MTIQFSVKNKFIVNGKEYESVEEMPDEIRAAYAKAKKGSTGKGHAVTLEMGKSKLVFNGQAYAGEDDMRQEEQELYEFVMKAMEKEGIPIPGGIEKIMGVPRPDTQIPDVGGNPIVPESSFSPRKLVSLAAILAFLLGVAYLWFSSGG